MKYTEAAMRGRKAYEGGGGGVNDGKKTVIILRDMNG